MAAPGQRHDGGNDNDNDNDNDNILAIIRGDFDAAAGEPVVLCLRPALRIEYAAKITGSIKNACR